MGQGAAQAGGSLHVRASALRNADLRRVAAAVPRTAARPRCAALDPGDSMRAVCLLRVGGTRWEAYWDVTKPRANLEDARHAFARLRSRLRKEIERVGQISARPK